MEIIKYQITETFNKPEIQQRISQANSIPLRLELIQSELQRWYICRQLFNHSDFALTNLRDFLKTLPAFKSINGNTVLGSLYEGNFLEDIV
jgi:hypothetical protein